MEKVKWDELTDEQIIDRSRNWSKEDWEKFLDETVPSGDQNFVDLDLFEFEDLVETKALKALYKEINCPRKIKKLISTSLRSVPSLEEKIINYFFYEGKTILEISRILNISKSTTLRRKEKALLRLPFICRYVHQGKCVPRILTSSKLNIKSLKTLRDDTVLTPNHYE